MKKIFVLRSFLLGVDESVLTNSDAASPMKTGKSVNNVIIANNMIMTSGFNFPNSIIIYFGLPVTLDDHSNEVASPSIIDTMAIAAELGMVM